MDLPVTLEQIREFNDADVPFCAEMNIGCDAIEAGAAIGRF